MTYKQLETSRELRLWLGQIIVPACGFAVMIMSNPEARRTVVNKVEDVKYFIKTKFKKN